MTYPSKVLKEIIKTFIEESIADNILLTQKGGETILANRSIYEIESFLVELRNLYQVNKRVDTSVVSQNILKYFTSIEAAAAFRPVDYQYNFLYHLAANYQPGTDLYSLIDSFTDNFKEQFTLADIVITSTGVTRCKTNIRFALNSLRDLSLVLSYDNNKKRSWGVSIMGLVALLNIQVNMEEAVKWDGFKNPDSLRPLDKGKQLDKLPAYFTYDPFLLTSVKQFKEPEHLYVYLSRQSAIALDDEEKKLLESLTLDYINFIEDGLEIHENGVRETKQFKDLSKTFQEKLFSIENSNPKLQQKLCAHFRK